jgi:PDZ domain-containing protein
MAGCRSHTGLGPTSSAKRLITDVDTIDPMVVPDPASGAPSPEGEARSPERHIRTFRWLIPTLLVAGVVGVLLNISLPYYALAPGDARQVNDLIAAPDDRAHPPDGRIYLTTVSLQRVKPLGALQGWLDKDVDVFHEERIRGKTPPKEYRQQNLQLMEDSKETAMVVAFRRVGYQVAEHGQGSLVVSVVEDLPANGRLTPGDTITAVDGHPVTLVQHAVDAIRARRPGEVVRLDVIAPSGESRVEEIALAEREGGPVLGVTMRTKDRRFDLPFDIKVDSGRIGGPSAGLAFTLGLIDELSQGELTGGQRVAVTGTIEMDGTVGDVGGVAQKTAAVRAEGVRYFIVPPGEYELARRHAGDGLTVLKAGTLEEALAALGSIGGDVVALPPPPG